MRAPQRLLPLLLRVLEVTVRSEYPDLDVRPCRPEGCARRGRRGWGPSWLVGPACIRVHVRCTGPRCPANTSGYEGKTIDPHGPGGDGARVELRGRLACLRAYDGKSASGGDDLACLLREAWEVEVPRREAIAIRRTLCEQRATAGQ